MVVEPASLGPAEWPARCEDVLRRMYDAVSRVTVPISISLSEAHGKHLGTGNFVDFGGIKTLVSCEHVLGKRKNNDLAQRVLGLTNLMPFLEERSPSLATMIRDVVRTALGPLRGRSAGLIRLRAGYPAGASTRHGRTPH